MMDLMEYNLHLIHFVQCSEGSVFLVSDLVLKSIVYNEIWFTRSDMLRTRSLIENVDSSYCASSVYF